MIKEPAKGYVQKGTAPSAEYVFETFETSVPSCPIIKIEISDKHGTDG